MYDRSAAFYDAIYHWKDYPGEVERLRGILAARGILEGALLDVACGTGKHLALLAESFEVHGVEPAEGMRRIARERVPAATLHDGDMRTFDLGRTFDVVTCLFSSIGYMTEIEDLNQAIANMARHGRLLIVEPWFHPHQWHDGHVGGDFHDGEALKVARVVKSWSEGAVSIMEMHHLVGEPGHVEHFVETMRMGLFTDAEYRAAFEAAGLRVEHDEEGLMGRGLYVGSQ